MQLHLRPRRRPVPAIPIVSLIDIMVILLIFFVATTTFRDKKPQIKINLPAAGSMSGTAPAEEVRLPILISPANEILVDGKAAPLEELASVLKGLKEKNPGLKLELEADKEADWGVMLGVWEALLAAGFPSHEVPARTQRVQPR